MIARIWHWKHDIIIRIPRSQYIAISIQVPSSFVIRLRALFYKEEGRDDLWQIPSATLERQVEGSELMKTVKKFITQHGKKVTAIWGEELHQKLMWLSGCHPKHFCPGNSACARYSTHLRGVRKCQRILSHAGKYENGHFIVLLNTMRRWETAPTLWSVPNFFFCRELISRQNWTKSKIMWCGDAHERSGLHTHVYREGKCEPKTKYKALCWTNTLAILLDIENFARAFLLVKILA